MAFRTKLDFSNNRQVKQFEKTQTVLSGGTSFGLTFSALTNGPDPISSGETNNVSFIASTFSGNSATTVFNWYDPAMSLGEQYFSAITPSNSAITQSVSSVFTPQSTTIIDGNTVALSYSGVGFDITPIAMYNLGGGAYSGTIETTDLFYYSASSLDYTGRTIWVDVSGITRTERLIVTDNPQIGYVLMCVNNEGMLQFAPVSATSSTSLWVSGSSANSVMIPGGGNTASGIFSIAEGFSNIASGTGSHAEGANTLSSNNATHSEGAHTKATGITSHAEGNYSIAGGISSHAEGDNTIALGDGSHAEGYQSIASGFASHAEGQQTLASGNQSHAEGYQTIASGQYSHAEGYRTVASNTFGSHAEGAFCVASNSAAHAEGDNTIASGQSSHAEGSYSIAGGDYSHAGGSYSKSIGTYSFVHGYNSLANGLSTIVLGTDITGTTANTTYINLLNIKSLGVYADNTAATSAGLEIGTVYRTSSGQLMIRY